jgi:acetyl-CoA decarbonylase/synthase complex subunit gamma
MLALFLGVISGAIVTPVLLPWLPGRAFAFKGLMPGIVGALTFFLIQWPAKTSKDFFELFAWILSIIVISTYLAMNFTGSSTYTSLSGVRKEMRIALPLQILGATCGLALWIVSVLMR